MRGKELECRCVRLPERITPAYAGKSHKVRLQAAGRWDHPRVCGEKCAWPPGCGSLTGSPLRMRGKVSPAQSQGLVARITPAYAGKSTQRLYDAGAQFGSPPRMRGKVVLPAQFRGHSRITPAYAGKSLAQSSAKQVSKDHPRVCGEKSHRCCFLRSVLGSPPRMRGKD